VPLIDLSHRVTDGMITYPGLPGPEIGAHMSFDDSVGRYAEGTEFAIGRVTMLGSTGTYIDTPSHRYRNGADLAGLPLESCAQLPARVVRPSGSVIGPADLPDEDLRGHAVLVDTGWDRLWGTPEYGAAEHPHLTEAAARHLVDRGAALVGIDSLNIDDTAGGERPVHSLLLGAGIPIVEHLTNLRRLPARGAVFTAVPPAIEGLSTFAVRAFAVVG
jgi:kynurenine formamidase